MKYAKNNNLILFKLTFYILLNFVLLSCQDIDHRSLDINELPENWNQEEYWGEHKKVFLEEFKSQSLNMLIEEGLRNNSDLNIAAVQMKEAYFLYEAVSSNKTPDLVFEKRTERSRSINNDAAFYNTENSKFLNLSWELDIWGKLKDQRNASLADYESIANIYYSGKLSLTASIIRLWFNAIEVRDQLTLAEETEKSFISTLSIVENRYKNGLAESIDTNLARIDLESAKENTERLKKDYILTIQALEVLIGRYPKGELLIDGALPVIAEKTPIGQPVQILTRRPDVVAALKKLEAANLRVSENQKRLLPGVSLTANAGNRSEAFEGIIDTNKLIWTIAGTISAPIFQRGKIKSEINQKIAVRDAELHQLRGTLYNAFLEVEDSVQIEKFLNKKEKITATSLQESSLAYKKAKGLYQKGVLDVDTLLDTQRTFFNFKSKTIQLKNEKLSNRLDLYLALGGHFFEDQNKNLEELEQ